MHYAIVMTARAFRTWTPAVTLAAVVISVQACGGRVGGPTPPVELGEGAGAGSSVSSSSSSSGGGASAGAAPSNPAGNSGEGTSSSSSGGSPIVADASLPATISEDAGVPPSSNPSITPACWDNQLPPEVQPILPTASVSASCGAAPMIAEWNTPIPDAGVMNGADARAAIVGRWVACTPGGGAFSATPHAGMEFGANGRWRLLVTDSSGALVPTTSTGSDAQGRYYALGTGQLDIHDNGFTYGFIDFISLSLDGNVLDFKPVSSSPAGGPYYARTSPSPNNGDNNLPSTTDGTCSMVGTWDLAKTASSSPATFSFDASGNFVGGPPGADLCASHTMYGTYRLSPGWFQITENYGMGVCAWWFDAGYPTVFDATCTHLSLTQHYDNCTGGRDYFNGQTTLVKRP